MSHNLGAVADLASRGVLLNSGKVVALGPIGEVISTYLAQGSDRAVYIAPPNNSASRPHIRKLEVVTSEGNGLHEYGERLIVKIWISHLRPMWKACFSLNVVNQFQHVAVHAWAFPPEHSYGSESGETVLTCTFPKLRLNVGHYHIRTHLTEPPGMEIYEKLDGLCPFEVVRTRDSTLFGWDPPHCVYHEDWSWEQATGGDLASSAVSSDTESQERMGRTFVGERSSK